jgi:hypothetical protein
MTIRYWVCSVLNPVLYNHSIAQNIDYIKSESLRRRKIEPINEQFNLLTYVYQQNIQNEEKVLLPFAWTQWQGGVQTNTGKV